MTAALARLGFRRVTFHAGYPCCIDCPESMGMYDVGCGPHSKPCRARKGCPGSRPLTGAAWTRKATFDVYDDDRRRGWIGGIILFLALGGPFIFAAVVIAMEHTR